LCKAGIHSARVSNGYWKHGYGCQWSRAFPTTLCFAAGSNRCQPAGDRRAAAQLGEAAGHVRWRTIEGKRYYLPGEVCDPIGKEWFYVEGDRPRLDEVLLTILTETRKRGANLLLDVGPNQHGLISEECRDALMRLRKNAGL
jgi:hypothetical protein